MKRPLNKVSIGAGAGVGVCCAVAARRACADNRCVGFALSKIGVRYADIIDTLDRAYFDRRWIFALRWLAACRHPVRPAEAGMKGFYYALVGVYNDLGYLARLGRYHAWRALMAVAWRVDLWIVRLHTHAFSEASRLERKKK